MGYIPTQPTVPHELPAPEICHHSAVPPIMPTGNARNRTLTKVKTETFGAVETKKRLPQHMVYPILNGAIIDIRISWYSIFYMYFTYYIFFVYPTNLHLVLGYNSSFYMSVVYIYIYIYIYVYTLYTYHCLKIRQFLDSLHCWFPQVVWCPGARQLGISTYLHLSGQEAET